MNWKALKSDFIEGLSPIYEQSESESLFYWIAEELTQKNRANFQSQMFTKVDVAHLNHIKQITEQLLRNEPIQYIFGKAYCYGRTFKVNPNVLIPRGETESLIHLVLEQIKQSNQTILDVGTGSGCIAINIKAEAPHLTVKAIDISEFALEVAKENARLNQVDIEWLTFDILNRDLWVTVLDQSLDVIVSNPPYVRNTEKSQMHPNVLEHEPHLALFVDDNNPLIFYQAIAQFAKEKLKPKGFLAFEINEDFGEKMLQLLISNRFVKTALHQDIHGKDRMVIGYKA